MRERLDLAGGWIGNSCRAVVAPTINLDHLAYDYSVKGYQNFCGKQSKLEKKNRLIERRVTKKRQ